MHLSDLLWEGLTLYCYSFFCAPNQDFEIHKSAILRADRQARVELERLHTYVGLFGVGCGLKQGELFLDEIELRDEVGFGLAFLRR